MRVDSTPARRGGRPPLAYLAFVDVPHPDRLPTDRVARARISGSFDFLDPRGESNVSTANASGQARARALARQGRAGCRQIETFLGIGCQIESGGTSAPYRSARRRVCRMFNDGRGRRFRVSETGPPNSRRDCGATGARASARGCPGLVFALVFVSPPRASRRGLP